MPNFIPGIPAQGAIISSAEIRENFLALDARTGKITPRATNPASTRVTTDGGIVYFADKIQVNVSPQAVDLGDVSTGVSPFTQDGFFRDVALVFRLSFNQTTSRYQATLTFVEGPEKPSSVSQPELIPLSTTDLPVARLVVRHNGIDNVLAGQIEPISQDAIIDYRNYIDVGTTTYFSASVGDRQVQSDGYGVIVTDGYGTPIIEGETVGSVVGGDNPIKTAIDNLAATGGTIFIKRGVYKVSESIAVPDNINLTGEGSSTIIQMQDSINGPLFAVVGDSCSFSNLTLEGDGSTTDPLISFTNSTKCSVTNCKITNAVNGIEYNSSTRNLCTGNYFDNNETAIRFTGSINNIVNSNQFENSSGSDIANDTQNQTIGNIYSVGL